MILGDFLRAVVQIGDRKFRSVLFRSLGITILLLVGFAYGVLWLLPDSISLPWFGEIDFLSRLISGFALFSMFILSMFLMVPVASVFTGFFLDEIADAVEAKHYANLSPAIKPPLKDVIGDSVKFFVLVVFANLVALILYLASTLFAPVIFWLVNGFLLGREYFQLVAMRRLGRGRAAELRRVHRGQIWLAGTLMTVPLTVPVVNLLVPILGVATFTHLFHRLNKR